MGGETDEISLSPLTLFLPSTPTVILTSTVLSLRYVSLKFRKIRSNLCILMVRTAEQTATLPVLSVSGVRPYPPSHRQLLILYVKIV